MFLTFGSIIVIIVSVNLCWCFGLVHSEILIPIFDLLFIALLPRIYKSNQEIRKNIKSRCSRDYKIPVRPVSQSGPSNKFIKHYLKKNLIHDKLELPINRLAYLKARYRIGPFSRYIHESEMPVSFLKKLAEPQLSLRGGIQDECHPFCFVTEFTEAYLESRALLYYIQGTKDVDTVYQVTFPLEVQDIQSVSSSATQSNPKFVFVPSKISEGERLDPDTIARGFKTTEDTERKREFEEAMRESKKKLESVRIVFNIMRQSKRGAPSKEILTDKKDSDNYVCPFLFLKKRNTEQ